MDEAIRAHGLAAKEFAEALLEVQERREALLNLVREDRTFGVLQGPSGFERPVERYERACARLCRAKEALDEAKSLDPRPVCEQCLQRLDENDLSITCSATGYLKKHRIKEAKDG